MGMVCGCMEDKTSVKVLRSRHNSNAPTVQEFVYYDNSTDDARVSDGDVVDDDDDDGDHIIDIADPSENEQNNDESNELDDKLQPLLQNQFPNQNNSTTDHDLKINHNVNIVVDENNTIDYQSVFGDSSTGTMSLTLTPLESSDGAMKPLALALYGVSADDSGRRKAVEEWRKEHGLIDRNEVKDMEQQLSMLQNLKQQSSLISILSTADDSSDRRDANTNEDVHTHANANNATPNPIANDADENEMTSVRFASDAETEESARFRRSSNANVFRQKSARHWDPNELDDMTQQMIAQMDSLKKRSSVSFADVDSVVDEHINADDQPRNTNGTNITETAAKEQRVQM